MTFGSGGGAPKTASLITDTAPTVQSFSNRDFYTCPLDTLAVITPLLFAYGSGSTNDPETYNFGGITIKQVDPITGGVARYNTCFGPMSALPFDVPHFGRIFLHPNVADAMNGNGLGPYVHRYDGYVAVPIVTNAGGGSAPTVTAKEGYGGRILLYPGETLSWSANNGYANATQWKLKYGLLEYGIAT